MDKKVLINTSDGIARLAGNKVLYTRLLHKFLNSEYMSELRLYIKDDNISEAARCIHTIKGVAANLSLDALYNSALQLETSLKGGVVNCKELDEFCNIYEKTAGAITEYENR